MKPTPITIGIFLSIALVVAAAGLYWMAVQAKAGEHHLAIATVQRIHHLESQWSIEMGRVRSDSFADFDSLAQFIPRMDRLKKTLADAIERTPSLPIRLVNNMHAYLSAVTAKEERIERFKTGYAVLRNSVRYLPLAASNVMQQMRTRGANSAFVRNVETVTDEINTYMTSPAPPEKERLMRVLAELGNNIASRHPALINTAMNFVAHGQVLLEKQAPTDEIFQAATSDQIGEMSEAIIEGLASEIEQTEALAAWYERGIIGTGMVLWIMWLTIAFKMPKGKDRTRSGGAPSRQRNLLRREQAGPSPDGGLERLTADLLAKRLPTPASKGHEDYAQLDLNDCVDEIVNTIQAKSPTLIVKELNPLPTVLATEADISLMFTHVMENAVWAIQERDQKEGIVRVETQQDRDSVAVTITDNGIGIQPKDHEKVFSAFYTTREGALGMGLTVTQHMVEKYEGTIVMNSVPNQGTVVRITLPASVRTE